MIGSLLGHCAQYRPHDIAVVFGDRRISFHEHHDRVGRCASVLQGLGLRRGDAVAVFMSNCVELLELYRAGALLGIGMVPISPLLQSAGVAMALRDSGAGAVFAQPSLCPVLTPLRAGLPHLAPERWVVTGPGEGDAASYEALLAPAVPLPMPVDEVDPETPFNIMYSSGTTGDPKGIVLTHRIRMMYALQFSAAFGIGHDSVVLHTGSLVFNGAFVTLLPAWLQGCTYILGARFDAADFIETVQREGVTHAMVVPSQIAALLDAGNLSPERLSSLRMLCTVGAPLPHEHRQRLMDVLPPNTFHELYGLTEGFATVLDGADAAAHPGSVGIPLPFNYMRIVDTDGNDVAGGVVGEILGRGTLLMPGYHRRPELTGQAIVDGWLHTGDLGYVDDAGFLHLVDRRKDLIISGGVNVYPRDIEDVAAGHAAVAEVAVFGVPHPRWGECAVAAVVPRHDAAPGTDELREWINAHVCARFQHVVDVVLYRELPRNVAGKALKHELRRRYLSEQAD